MVSDVLLIRVASSLKLYELPISGSFHLYPDYSGEWVTITAESKTVDNRETLYSRTSDNILLKVGCDWPVPSLDRQRVVDDLHI